ncbi:MAG: hypothetical protein K0S51_1134 [Bacillales bacterium]|nr:hypothetical protein [Bacillales bacterium]
MLNDFKERSLIGYLIMFVCSLFLVILSKVLKTYMPIAIGNCISFLASYKYINDFSSSNEIWGNYFKPLTPHGLVIFVSLVLIVYQIVLYIKSNKLEAYMIKLVKSGLKIKLVIFIAIIVELIFNFQKEVGYPTPQSGYEAAYNLFLRENLLLIPLIVLLFFTIIIEKVEKKVS